MEEKADEIILTPGFIVKNDKEYYLTEYGKEYEVWQCKPQFDLSNQYCGRLKVVCRTAPPEHVTDTEQAFWLCKCQCGNYCVVRRKNLINETTKSCGCYYNDTRHRKKYNNIFEFKDSICEVYDHKHERSFIIDSNMVEKIKTYYWEIKKNGYVRSKIDNKEITLHRFILDAPDNKIVDHINRNPSDNRLENLRLCDATENTRNKSLNSKNTSGVMGVSKNQDGAWYSYIMINGKNKHLYRGYNKLDAIVARLRAESIYYKEFAPQKHLFDKYGIPLQNNNEENENDRPTE